MRVASELLSVIPQLVVPAALVLRSISVHRCSRDYAYGAAE